jgi:hypothetical protein
MRTYNTLFITTLADNQVFVFGANAQGFHGAGAAGYASFNEHGNVWREHKYEEKPHGWKGKWNQKGKTGFMIGTEGKSYGLITVSRAGAKRSIPPDQLIKNIREFYEFADDHPHLEFIVAQRAEGGLNGYTGKEMAMFFLAAGDPPMNVIFQREFAALMG